MPNNFQKVSKEINKAYLPSEVEARCQKYWEELETFKADAQSKAEPYSIVIPPPNVTGILTLGHALNGSIQDALARRARSVGREVLWLPGMDHAGIATQNRIVNSLRQEGKDMREMGREEFLKAAWEWKEKHGGIIIKQFKKLGCSCDWGRLRFTMDTDYSQWVEKVFIDLFKKKYIYRGRYMVNWCPTQQTALSDEEVIMRPEKSKLYFVKYQVPDSAKFIVAATTRPETIMGDVAVAVHPDDERYQDFIGKNVIAPLPLGNEKGIPVIADEAVEKDFGAGALKITPAHDKLDFEIGQRHNLPIIEILDDAGKIDCPSCPELHGLDRSEARELAAELLEKNAALLDVKDHQNNIGYSERGGEPVEPKLSTQWFLRYPSAQEAADLVENDKIKFYPRFWKKTYKNWMNGLRDWCISRQLWWGHRIPAYYNPNAKNDFDLIWQGKTQVLKTENISNSQLVDIAEIATKVGEKLNKINATFTLKICFVKVGENIKILKLRETSNKNIKSWEIAELNTKFAGKILKSLKSKEDLNNFSYRIKLAHLLAENDDFLLHVTSEDPSSADCKWQRDEDALDTWFSSWLWPFATMANVKEADDLITNPQSALLDKFYPTSTLVTAPDIIFFWVARMIMAGVEYTSKLPFANVFFTSLIRDAQGRKLSKSLGNSPDPLDLVDKYGADALRMGLLRTAPSGQDVRFDEKQIEEGRNFATKLWNAARFRMMQIRKTSEKPDPRKKTHSLPPVACVKILLDLAELESNVESAFADFNFHKIANELYRFFWERFCDLFLEAAKADLQGDDERRAATLICIDVCFARYLAQLAALMPHICEELWRQLGFDKLGIGKGETSSHDGELAFAHIAKLQSELNPLANNDSANIDSKDAREIEKFCSRMYASAAELRRLKAELNLSSRRDISFYLKVKEDLNENESRLLREELHTLCKLIGASSINFRNNIADNEPSVLTHFGKFALPISENFNEAQLQEELARCRRDLKKVVDELGKSERKLANENFTQRAKPEIVEQERSRLENWQSKRLELEAAIQSLGG